MQEFIGELCWCLEWDGYVVSWSHKRLSFFIRRIFYKAKERSCAAVKTNLVNTYPHTATDCSRLTQQMLRHSHSFLSHVALHSDLPWKLLSGGQGAPWGWQLTAAQIVLLRMRALSQKKRRVGVRLANTWTKWSLMTTESISFGILYWRPVELQYCCLMMCGWFY